MTDSDVIGPNGEECVCGSCVYWKPFTFDIPESMQQPSAAMFEPPVKVFSDSPFIAPSSKGECRKHGPTLRAFAIGDNRAGVWPETLATDICGDFNLHPTRRLLNG